MEDVQNDVSAKTVEETTTEASQATEQTQEAQVETAAQEAQERMVPISVVQKERKQRQELQKKLAEIEGSQRLNGYDQNDMEQVLSHPYVQELLVKQAKQELTDFARATLDEFPTLNPAVKKAILKNARGFVNETTTDVETAKLDLREYIESIVENEAETQPTTPKTFPVAATNVVKADVPGIRPADIQKILEKPIDEWTDEEASVVETYSRSQK
jgi:hypothetical protein